MFSCTFLHNLFYFLNQYSSFLFVREKYKVELNSLLPIFSEKEPCPTEKYMIRPFDEEEWVKISKYSHSATFRTTFLTVRLGHKKCWSCLCTLLHCCWWIWMPLDYELFLLPKVVILSEFELEMMIEKWLKLFDCSTLYIKLCIMFCSFLLIGFFIWWTSMHKVRSNSLNAPLGVQPGLPSPWLTWFWICTTQPALTQL